jgi:hypothetical protein
VTRNIGGQLDYAKLAELHRPADQQAIANEVRRLHSEGLKPRDIASALHLGLNAVLALLRVQP